MAEWRTYKCECGWEVNEEPTGEGILMSGSYFCVICEKCKKLFWADGDYQEERNNIPNCPGCGAGKEYVRRWNPVDGPCPKCGRKLQEVPGELLFVD